MQNKLKNHLSYISSGALAGVIAIISVYKLVYSFSVLLISFSDEIENYKPDTNQKIYTVLSLLMLSLYVVMYFNYRKLNLHKIIWPVTSLFYLIYLGISITKKEEFTFFSALYIHEMLIYAATGVYGYFLALAEINNWPETEQDVNQQEKNNVLPQYFRPALTSAALAIMLVVFTFQHLLRALYFLFSDADKYSYDSSYIFSKTYFAGSLTYILACIYVYFVRDNARLQRLGWFICIVSSIVFFIPVISIFDAFALYRLHTVFFPLAILFLTIRGYALTSVEEELRNRDQDQHNTEENMYDWNKPFYATQRPAGFTSSRLGLAALFLYIPVVLYAIGFVSRPLTRSYPDYEVVLILIPVFLVVSGYMFIYNSPARPHRHKSWWWLSFALNGIIGLVIALSAMAGRGEVPMAILFGTLALVSYFGISRADLDNAYERRKA